MLRLLARSAVHEAFDGIQRRNRQRAEKSTKVPPARYSVALYFKRWMRYDEISDVPMLPTPSPNGLVHMDGHYTQFKAFEHLHQGALCDYVEFASFYSERGHLRQRY